MNLQQAIDHARENVNRRNGQEGRLGGKVAIITGGAQGFGKGLAEEMYAHGADVVVADLNYEMAQQTAQSLGSRAFALSVDVSDQQSVEKMVCDTVEHFGGLDIMVSNAGVLKAGGLDEISLKDFEFVTNVNFKGYYLCACYASKIMKAQFQGNSDKFFDIIQINSKSGLAGSNKNFTYSSGKFGGIGMTQSMALELAAFNIKVNSICPGNFFEGPLWSHPENGLFVQYLRAGKVPGATCIEDVKKFYESKAPLNRGCRVIDVSRALLYAVEQLYETGQAIPVTGGQIMMN